MVVKSRTHKGPDLHQVTKMFLLKEIKRSPRVLIIQRREKAELYGLLKLAWSKIYSTLLSHYSTEGYVKTVQLLLAINSPGFEMNTSLMCLMLDSARHCKSF